MNNFVKNNSILIRQIIFPTPTTTPTPTPTPTQTSTPGATPTITPTPTTTPAMNTRYILSGFPYNPNI